MVPPCFTRLRMSKMSLALAYTQLQPMKKLRSMSLASVPSCKAVLSAVVDTPGWLCKEDEKENVDDKGKKPMREEDLPQEQADGDEEAADSPGSRTDMELAWENLEVAKYIYEHEPQGNHAKELADVHTLLADIGMEQESFESAMTDHKRALELLSTILQADDRRLAELHYKMSLTLQYLDQPEDALKEIKTAVRIVETRIDNIKAAPGHSSATGADPTDPTTSAGLTAQEDAGSTATEASAAAVPSQDGTKPAAGTADGDSGAAQQELTDLKSVLEDMYEKVEELQQVLKEHLSTKNALKAAFSQIAGSLGPPQLGGSSGAGPSSSSAPSAVVDLGVVGRGTKRVTPMPMPTLPGTAGGTNLSKPVPQKRSLEDLMSGGPVSSTGALPAFGSSNGTVSIGFSGASLPATGFDGNILGASNSPWPPAPAAAKKQKTGLAEKSSNAAPASGQVCAGAVSVGHTTVLEGSSDTSASAAALPAFLQPASVTAAYGNETMSQKD
ncbi:hypothetical protein ABBQ32_008006 [Trebouxia sp. C0010 RCD-2024]